MLIDKKEILFIINPNSGKKNPAWIIDQIKKVDPSINFVVTHNKQELESVFIDSLEKFKAFVAVGGDGTVHEIVRYLKNNKDKVLAIYPNGSGNGFANELFFGKNIKSLITDILRGETIDIDALNVNDNPCINILGLGFDSFIAHNFQNSTRGLRNYIFSTVKSVFQFKPFEASITTSEREINGTFLMVSVTNSRQYGNYAIASPKSIPNDGIFEIILVKPFPSYLYPVYICRMFLATLKDSKYIQYIKEAKSATIVSDYKKYHIDGDPYISDGSVKVSIHKNSVRVIRTKKNLMPCPEIKS